MNNYEDYYIMITQDRHGDRYFEISEKNKTEFLDWNQDEEQEIITLSYQDFKESVWSKAFNIKDIENVIDERI